MKRVLIQPDWKTVIGRNDFLYNRTAPPLELLNIASMLRLKKQEVLIVDAFARRLKDSAVAEIVERGDDVIISTATIQRWQCPTVDIRPVMTLIEALSVKKTRLFIAGPHGTLAPDIFLGRKNVAGVIIGEPEETAVELLSFSDISDVKGVAYIKEGSLHLNEPRAPVNMDLMPPPAYDLLDMLEYSHELFGSEYYLFEGARGCRHSCSFCAKNIMYGDSFRQKDPIRLAEEVKQTIGNEKECAVNFLDLTFTENRDWTLRFCNALKKHAFVPPWACQTRTDRVDPEMLKQMHEAGCRLIIYGVETPDATLLKAQRKGGNPDLYPDVFNMTRKAGIETCASIIIGLKGQTNKDILKQGRFARSLGADYLNTNIAVDYSFSSSRTVIPGKFFPLIDRERSFISLKVLAKAVMIDFFCRPAYLSKKCGWKNMKAAFAGFKLFLKFMFA